MIQNACPHLYKLYAVTVDSYIKAILQEMESQGPTFTFNYCILLEVFKKFAHDKNPIQNVLNMKILVF